MTTTKSVKFVASITGVNPDVDVLVDDIRTMGTDGIMYFVNEALDSGKPSEIVYVVDEDETLAENTATLLNATYEKEMKLIQGAKNMKPVEKKEVIEQAKKEVEDAIKSTVVIEEEDNAAAIAKSAAAKKFLAKHSGALANAKKSSENKSTKSEEEKEMNNTKEETKGAGRRRLSTMGANKEVKGNKEVKENKSNKTNKGEKEMTNTTKGTKGASRRLSTGGRTAATTSKKEQGRRRLGRSASIKSDYKTFEGPWYLNAELYPVLNRLEDIVATLRDDELGIQEIALVDPSEIRRYENREDLNVIIQVLSNGNVLEFPIKYNESTNSKSDLKSSSIGWVETKKGLRPAFGFYRPNAMEVKVTCDCGNEFKANSGNVYCPKCRVRHDDIIVSADHDTLDFEFDGEWVFQTIPNMSVPRETLALVMAIAQYDEGLDMHDLIDEDGEEA